VISDWVIGRDSRVIERKLAAIMFTDIVGFTKITCDDETTALSILENYIHFITFAIIL